MTRRRAGKSDRSGLIIQGGHDCQIPPENGERLIRTAPDNQYAEIATMNHVLKATPADCAAAIASYNNPRCRCTGTGSCYYPFLSAR